MRTNFFPCRAALLFLAGIASLVAGAVHAGSTPVGTAFTYQGQLKQGGEPIDNTADLQFSLWDGSDGSATQVGTTLQIDGIDIVEGAFTVDLDFGASAFGVDARWLQMAVRSPAGSGTFTTLSPRQRVRPAPVASHALNVNGETVTNLSASNIATGTIGSPLLSGTYSNALTLNNSANVFAGSGAGLFNLNLQGPYPQMVSFSHPGNQFAGNGFGLALNANQLVVGTIPGACLAGTYSNSVQFPNGVFQGTHIGLGAQLTGLRAAALVDTNGPVPGSVLFGAYPGQLSFSNVNNVIAGNGAALTSLNASNISSGNLNSARMPTGGTWALSSTQLITGPLGFVPALRSTSEDFNGIEGITNENGGVGVYGINNAGGRGVAGQASGVGSFGVYAHGNSGASGTKSFQIDHPRDPENSYLLHYSAEGPEPFNLYRGNVVLNGAGEAGVQLPDYFQDINRDFHYQLTAIGAPSPNLHIALEIVNNQFMVAGGQPGAKVSWTVTAVRNDEYVRHYPTTDVREKPAHLKGTYQHPEIFGQPAEKGELHLQAPLANQAE